MHSESHKPIPTSPSAALEICESCHTPISKNEAPYVYQGQQVVCEKCYGLLSVQDHPPKPELARTHRSTNLVPPTGGGGAPRPARMMKGE